MSAYFEGSPEKVVQHYDLDQGPSLFPNYADDLAHRLARLRHSNLLETAARTGFLTRKLHEMLPATTRITATDLVAVRLDVARPEFREREVAFQVTDALALPHPDNSFDVVVCQFGVMFFPDKDASYREAHRVLACGGHYLFNVWDSHRYNSFGGLLHEVVNRASADGLGWNAPFSYHEIDPIKESLLRAGFTNISATIVSLETTVPSAVASPLTREFGPDPFRMPLQAIVLEAQKLPQPENNQ